MVLISKKHNFVIIKSKKVAGTTLEAIISDAVEDEAIVSPFSELNFLNTIRRFEGVNHEEDWRKQFNLKSPRNYTGNLFEESVLYLKQFVRYIPRKLRYTLRLNLNPLEQKRKAAKLKDPVNSSTIWVLLIFTGI